MSDAWITKVALEIGLHNGELHSALAYAGTQNWLANNQKEASLALRGRMKLGLRTFQLRADNNDIQNSQLHLCLHLAWCLMAQGLPCLISAPMGQRGDDFWPPGWH